MPEFSASSCDRTVRPSKGLIRAIGGGVEHKYARLLILQWKNFSAPEAYICKNKYKKTEKNRIINMTTIFTGSCTSVIHPKVWHIVIAHELEGI